MIKLIALDLIGVLLREGDELLNPYENKKEKSNLNEIFIRLKKEYPNIILVIASNYVSDIRDYLEYNFPDADDYFISSEINKYKPNADFYKHILNEFNIRAKEMLFVDDSQVNVDGAASLGIQTIKIDRYDDVYAKIIELLSINA